MTRVEVDPGICGLHATIAVDKADKHKVRVAVTSQCEMVTELGGLLTGIDQFDAIKQRIDCETHQIASRCRLHAACPVPVAILKAIEVEAGLSLPRDVSIRFQPAERR